MKMFLKAFANEHVEDARYTGVLQLRAQLLAVCRAVQLVRLLKVTPLRTTNEPELLSSSWAWMMRPDAVPITSSASVPDERLMSSLPVIVSPLVFTYRASFSVW